MLAEAQVRHEGGLVPPQRPLERRPRGRRVAGRLAEAGALDTELGRLLAQVDFTKTLVIFVGDNGVPPPVKDAATGLRDAKGSAYEGGVRVPLVVAGAGVTRRGREDNLFVTTDLYATILDVAGVPVSHVNDSYSLKPLFADEAASSGRTF
ncbi:MAG TPA: sulfatase-like hydrolase/transferase, partial [Polyangia bacterium]